MRKSLGNPKLAIVLGGKSDTGPLAECRGAFANVYSNIQYFAGNDAHQLILGMFYLVMQTAQHTFV
ncbi:hypothetical protein D3C81_2233770 [compost metagenome]